MTDRPTGMLGDVLGFLKNYHSNLMVDDIAGGRPGHPHFKTDAEFELYMSQLETTIKMLKDNK